MAEYGTLPARKNEVIGLEWRPIFLLSKERRIKELKKAKYNLFRLSNNELKGKDEHIVFIDLLTDSGTGAITPSQWLAGAAADYSYASNKSYEFFVETLKNFTGKEIILPVHQGRAAEHKLAWQFIKQGDVVLSNHLFDTTRANFEMRGALCIDIPAPISTRSHKDQRFRGNIDLEKLERYVARSELKTKIKCLIMTLTDNTGGGQPATLENIRLASEIAKKYKLLFIIDGSRVAQNAHFIWKNEAHTIYPIPDIIREIFSYCDIGYMSLKKNGAHMGGCIVTNAPHMLESKKAFLDNLNWLEELQNKITITEGLVIGYGGISGRDMAEAAVGLMEVVSGDYLERQIGQAAYLQFELEKAGAIIKDSNLPGGHAVYVDAGRLLPHIPKNQFPAHALAVALYEEGGVRTCDIGSLMFDGAEQEILRFAIPAHVYSQEHFDYTVQVFKRVLERKNELKGFKITWQPKFLRHFSCHLEPIS